MILLIHISTIFNNLLQRDFHNKIASQRLKRDPISKNEFLEKNSSPFLTANLTSNFFDGFSIVKTFDIGVSILDMKYSKLDFGLKYIFFISSGITYLASLNKGLFFLLPTIKS